VPGGLAESPAAVQGLEALAAVTSAPPTESPSVVLSTDAEETIHWALERMMASGLDLSSDLHELRGVVEPVESG
jgi:hypothetical protein